MDRISFSLRIFLMRQMLPPVMRRNRTGRVIARATVQGDVLGIRGSGKRARKVPLSEKRGPSSVGNFPTCT